MRRFFSTPLWRQIERHQQSIAVATTSVASSTTRLCSTSGDTPSANAEGDEKQDGETKKKERAPRLVHDCPYKRPPIPRKDSEFESETDLRDRIFETDLILDILKERHRKAEKLKDKSYYSKELFQIDSLVQGMSELEHSETDRNLVKNDWSVIGIDETGVGAWAGPIVVSAAQVPMTIDTLYVNAQDEEVAQEFTAAHRRLERDIAVTVDALKGDGDVSSEEELEAKAKDLVLSGKNTPDGFASATIDAPRLLTSAAAIELNILAPPRKSQVYDEMCLQLPTGSHLIPPMEGKKEFSPVLFAPRPAAVRDSKTLTDNGIANSTAAIDRYLERGLLRVSTKILQAHELENGIKIPQEKAQVDVCAGIEDQMLENLWKVIEANQSNLVDPSTGLPLAPASAGEAPEGSVGVVASTYGPLKYILPPRSGGFPFDEDFERQKIRELVLLPRLMVLMDGEGLSDRLVDRYCPANLTTHARMMKRSPHTTYKPPGLTKPQRLLSNVRDIPKGDGLSFSIAVASIVSKHRQTQEAMKLHEQYPNYGFDSHHGYGTAPHIEAVRNYGSIPGVHRSTFYSDQLRQAQAEHTEAATRPGKDMGVSISPGAAAETPSEEQTPKEEEVVEVKPKPTTTTVAVEEDASTHYSYQAAKDPEPASAVETESDTTTTIHEEEEEESKPVASSSIPEATRAEDSSATSDAEADGVPPPEAGATESQARTEETVEEPKIVEPSPDVSGIGKEQVVEAPSKEAPKQDLKKKSGKKQIAKKSKPAKKKVVTSAQKSKSSAVPKKKKAVSPKTKKKAFKKVAPKKQAAKRKSPVGLKKKATKKK